jgi:hypothetical protein
MPQVPKHQVGKVGVAPSEIPHVLPSTNYDPKLPKKLPNLPGVTITIVRPYPQTRAHGELARTKAGPEITVRVNTMDKTIIDEGAKLCGLRTADYVRQCALHTTQAMKAQHSHDSDPRTATDPHSPGIPGKP